MIKDRIWTLVSRKLSGEATTSELTELTDLIKTQANADLYLQAIDEFWKIPIEKDEEFLEATYHLHLNRLKEKGFDLETDKDKDDQSSYIGYSTGDVKKSNRKKIIPGISLFSLLVILFFLRGHFKNQVPGSLNNNKVEQSEVSTKTGSRTRIQLPDGSSVWLNGGSKLVYDNRHFGENTREVSLSGEGYFDIVKNKERPFVIHAGKISIKVVGTTFNVRAYPGEKNTETSLIRGNIEVTVKDRKEKITMNANDKLIISNADIQAESGNAITQNSRAVSRDTFIYMKHLTLANDENTVVETAWVENKLIFDKETFEEVALKMEKWYGVSIRFADDKLKRQRLTGTFEKETVTEALRALQISTPFFKYKISNEIIDIFN